MFLKYFTRKDSLLWKLFMIKIRRTAFNMWKIVNVKMCIKKYFHTHRLFNIVAMIFITKNFLMLNKNYIIFWLKFFSIFFIFFFFISNIICHIKFLLILKLIKIIDFLVIILNLTIRHFAGHFNLYRFMCLF